ncbi:4'-phosphopantetheinyl transferase family protein [Yoonia sp. R2-816]|uniref:4'-phosphopantetheinyl transferase family protein n=1 Tax=Yoonia sp. R2-816 TaxID=3342638 RepID=UPI00372B408B
MAQEQIILRWIETGRLRSRHHAAFAAILDDEERARARHFRFKEDEIMFTAAHALARCTLSEIDGRPPHSWTFRIGPYGKPAVVVAQDAPEIRFNLSHTKGLTIVAVAIGRDIGVDVEKITHPAPLEIADRYFTRQECDLLLRSAGRRRDAAFFSIWTLKEAYMKALSRGMDLPLDSFVVDLDPAHLARSDQDKTWERWQFWQDRIGASHIAALAVDWPDADALPISGRAVDPNELSSLCGAT